MTQRFDSLRDQITACQICAGDFAKTHSAHRPRPVFWVTLNAPILIAGQAPGARVQASGVPFSDRSGARLRHWMGLTEAQFYDQSQISILPMAFCFPGYSAKGADMAPPKICAKTWHAPLLAEIAPPKLTLLIGGVAQKYHLSLGAGAKVGDTVRRWRDFGPGILPLPHPSWRNTGWLKKNPWFEAELLPELQKRLRQILPCQTLP